MWEKVSAISTFLSVIVSLSALIVAILGAISSSKIATEALETARQANDIALGRIREPAAVEFSSTTVDEFDFSEPSKLSEELKEIITIKNIGKVPIDGLSLEIIGIAPLTYPLDNPSEEVRPLPSVIINISLKNMLQPSALAHVDMRLPILMYLKKLDAKISNKSRAYKTAINLVLQPKAVGDRLPSLVRSDLTKNDIAQRVYAP